ncbi:glycoside hydrolase [Abortiporus biennis]|nr:glycoside hydrolase [Abortiporus biennis]
MMGNAYPFGVSDFVREIKLASASGIDAFALNIGTDYWQPDHVKAAYDAAQQSGTDFKMFISFDMSVFPCSSSDNAAALRKYITDFSNHPSQLKYNGKVFASTFAGESCTFGAGNSPDGWKTQFTQHPDLQGDNAVHFVPSFFIDPSTQFSQYNGVIDGMFNFNSGWPLDLTEDKVNQILGSSGIQLNSAAGDDSVLVNQLLKDLVGSTGTDDAYIDGLKSVSSSATYMGAVSPWFFTHYGADSFNKNFVYYSDSHLYVTRWNNIIQQRDKFDLVEIATWNDYGESHYIGPIDGAQPNSQAWVDGFDHQGWLDMTKYYATAYKTGAYPEITEDKIYMWARPHTKHANAPDPVGRPTNAGVFEDTLWIMTFTTAPSTVTITTSTDGSNPQVFNVQQGATKLLVPLTVGSIMHGTITRDGKTIVDLQPKDFTFNGNPQAYNYNAFVAFAGSNGT